VVDFKLGLRMGIDRQIGLRHEGAHALPLARLNWNCSLPNGHELVNEKKGTNTGNQIATLVFVPGVLVGDQFFDSGFVFNLGCQLPNRFDRGGSLRDSAFVELRRSIESSLGVKRRHLVQISLQRDTTGRRSGSQAGQRLIGNV
jgi:hypothetical protein